VGTHGVISGGTRRGGVDARSNIDTTTRVTGR
jgi:hypothetical protein